MDLKNCPQCGDALDVDDPDTLYPNGLAWVDTPAGRKYIRRHHVIDPNDCWHVVCPVHYGGCGLELHADTRDDAIKHWNSGEFRDDYPSIQV